MSSDLPARATVIFSSDFAQRGWGDSSNVGGAEGVPSKPTTRSGCSCAASMRGIPAWDRTNWRVTAGRKPVSVLAAEPSTGSLSTRARGKKNGAGRSFSPEGVEGFLCWGGEHQEIYERWRQTALLGGDVASFLQWGMTLLAPGCLEGSRRIYQVRRRRASIRAGDFSLGDLFSQFGIEWVRLPNCPERSSDSTEVRP